MHVEILVEEPSAEAAIDVLLNRLGARRSGTTDRIITFRGKDRMLQRLSPTLQSIARAGFTDHIIILIDQDSDDCVKLKSEVIEMANSAGISTTSATLRVRIAIAELESWFLGDPAAVRATYPGITAGDLRALIGREPDDQRNPATWLQDRLKRRKYYAGRMPKVEVARNIAANLNLDPNHNTSRSFRLFLRTLREVYGLSTDESSSQSPST